MTSLLIASKIFGLIAGVCLFCIGVTGFFNRGNKDLFDFVFAVIIAFLGVWLFVVCFNSLGLK